MCSFVLDMVHRDLKLENVLLSTADPTEKFNIKVRERERESDKEREEKRRGRERESTYTPCTVHVYLFKGNPVSESCGLSACQQTPQCGPKCIHYHPPNSQLWGEAGVKCCLANEHVQYRQILR